MSRNSIRNALLHMFYEIQRHKGISMVFYLARKDVRLYGSSHLCTQSNPITCLCRSDSGRRNSNHAINSLLSSLINIMPDRPILTEINIPSTCFTFPFPCYPVLNASVCGYTISCLLPNRKGVLTLQCEQSSVDHKVVIFPPELEQLTECGSSSHQACWENSKELLP